MSVDFTNIPDEAIAYNRGVLKAMKEHADAGDTIIQYGGGFTILHAYEEWQDSGCAGELIIFKTELGCELAKYVEVWLNINASAALSAYGRDSDEFTGAVEQLRFIGIIACKALANENAPATYQLWQDNNRNTPATITEEELRLAYTAEVLQFGVELWNMRHEKRTLH